MGVMRMRLALIGVVVLAGIGIALGILLTRDSSASYRGSLPPVRVPLPAFQLSDQHGQSVRSADLDGKVVVVTFLDTQCQAECPIVASLLGSGMRLLSEAERREVAIVAVSSDPPGDTPERIVDFLTRQRAQDVVRFLNGPVEAVRPVWKAFAVVSSYDTGVHDLHSIPVRIFDGRGYWVSTLNAGADLTAENLAHDVREALQSD
jgi:protein SCO1